MRVFAIMLEGKVSKRGTNRISMANGFSQCWSTSHQATYTVTGRGASFWLHGVITKVLGWSR